MHRVDRSQVREALHEYKKECYLLEHTSEKHKSVETETRRIVDEILAQNFHYHLRRPINSESAETLGLIESYIREAVLPPVVDSLVEKLVIMEKKHEAGIRCLEQIIKLTDQD